MKTEERTEECITIKIYVLGTFYTYIIQMSVRPWSAVSQSIMLSARIEECSRKSQWTLVYDSLDLGLIRYMKLGGTQFIRSGHQGN